MSIIFPIDKYADGKINANDEVEYKEINYRSEIKKLINYLVENDLD